MKNRSLIRYALGGAAALALLWAALQLFSGDAGAPLVAEEAIFDIAGLAAQEKADLAKAQKLAREAIERSKQLEAEADQAKGEAEKIQLQSVVLAARIQSAEAEIQGQETKLEAINRQLQRHQQSLAKQRKPLMQLTGLLQQLSRRPPVTVLAQPGSINDMVHARAIIEAVMPEVEKRTADVRTELAQMRTTLAQQQVVLQQHAASRTKLDEQRQGLRKLEADNRARLQQLANSAQLEADRAMGLGERARDITALMAALELDAQKRSELIELAGPLPRPKNPDDPVIATPPPAEKENTPTRGAYRMPVVGRMITGFGELDDSGVRSRGVRLLARSGAQVVAPASGRISYAGDYRGYGKIIIIDHGGSWISLIAGMNALSAKVGDEVALGAPIGRAGSADQAITLELRRSGKPVDVMALMN